MKKKILMISSRPPYPLVAGYKIRIFYTLKALCEKYKVDLLFLNEGKLDKSIVPVLSEVVSEVIPFNFAPLQFKINALKGVFSALPFQVHYYYFKEVQKWIKENFRKYDLIFCQHIRTAEYVKDLPVKKFIDLHDAISMNYFRTAEETSWTWKCIKKIERGKVLNYELQCVSKFDKCSIVSFVDKGFLVRNGADSSKVKVIPVAVREDILDKEKYEKGSPEEEAVVFLGKMDYRPNIDAVTWFANKVFPLVIEKKPGIKFYIVGAYPTREVKRLANENVVVTGYVDDPYSYIKRAKVFVAPMVSGAGIQNKILEAMSLGKAVVTTRIGAEGIEGENNIHFVIANDPVEFAEEIIQLLDDEEKRRYLGQNARRLILAKYTWKRVGQMFLDEIKELLEG